MIFVADNLHIVNPVVEQAILHRDPGPIRDLVTRCVAAGAQAIDINPGPLKKDPEAAMTFLVNTVATATDLPLLLDTTNAAALAAGLAACKNPVIINGFSLEPRKIETILPLAKRFDADIVGFLLDERSRVPVDVADCLEVAGRLLAAAEKAGVNPARLIIDPVIAPLMWENGVRHNRAVVEVIRMLPDLFGLPVRAIAGLSNLTTGPGPKEKKRTAEVAFLAMLADAGLSLALVNIFHHRTVDSGAASEHLLRSDIFSWEGV
ncbi:dihydropteroate synthase [Desulfosudis oleivorans]|uniref:Dihydropteroate synthase DHPS n=1 Tax=Desulfosudis oleivorans (strain DSM 6200 / JCM 39069 / Hxd3) TaxID=96561 RepID=A8ZWP8_DESOH|nr:dihydropteroate synthase [Desulfosudis oleivorans]ABW68379.1 dihydropteroate synthase DHPS [Desulfosudis oleivorans Hxd3]